MSGAAAAAAGKDAKAAPPAPAPVAATAPAPAAGAAAGAGAGAVGAVGASAGAAAAAAAAAGGGGSAKAVDDFEPTSNFVDPMLTDMYQISMAYGYWKTGRHDEDSVFDLFFRQNPFHGEFTIFAGLEEVLRYVHSFRFKAADIQTLKSKFADWDAAFWDWLATLDTSKVKIFAIPEGTIVFPREPLLRIEGPLAVCQLLETTALVLVNYASLLCTNAARHRLAVGPKKKLLEFGLRRAQGPDGAMSASRYAFIGGFDGTSNVKAGLMFGIPISGTHAHSFVTSFTSVHELKTKTLLSKVDNKQVDFVELTMKYQQKYKRMGTNKGELAAFIAYAQSFPTSFLALVDTYDTLESGLWNFIFVALALHDCGYQANGIRLDSGDLAYLSQECRRTFQFVEKQEKINDFGKLTIVASNDLSEEVLWALKEQKHEVDCFGIGTNLVTCKSQPALGCVYKLVEVKGQARIKISQDIVKVTIPGRKECYRLFNAKGEPVIDLLLLVESNAPSPQKRILCRHPFDANKRCYVTPTKVVQLHECVWDGKLIKPFPNLHQLRQRVVDQLAVMRPDFLRRVNPTPYKLSLSSELYTYMHDLWQSEMPIAEIT